MNIMEGDHRKAVFNHEADFLLETGEVLPGFQLYYEVLGNQNIDSGKIIWVCHALTGNATVTDWWDGLFGKGKLFDPQEYAIICVNALGGCYGSTGPLSVKQGTNSPYFHSFPTLTNRDIVKAFDLLRLSLSLERIHTLIGGSLGGQQALEWAILQPGLFENLIVVASNAQHSPWGIAFNESQRMAIALDKTWTTKDVNAGMEGMKIARSIALLSYRSYETYERSQTEEDQNKLDSYKASGYQRYQGEKLAKRFNAFSYWVLSKAMDSHHVGRQRGGTKAALKKIRANTLVIGVDSDLLFPVSEQEFIASHIEGAQFHLINSCYGHDGFLIETPQIENCITKFYNQVSLKTQKI